MSDTSTETTAPAGTDDAARRQAALYLALAFAEAGAEPPDDPAELDRLIGEIAAAPDDADGGEDGPIPLGDDEYGGEA